MNPELHRRVLAFEREIQRRCATRTVQLGWGWAVLRDDLPLVYDLNAVVVARAVDDTSEVLDTTERLLAGAGLTHRRVIVDEPAAASALVPVAEARGWHSSRDVAMVLRRAPDRSVATDTVTELGPQVYAPLQRRFTAEEPWAAPGVLDQMTVAFQTLAAVATLRCFAAFDGDEPQAGCLLIGAGDAAQIDSVHTVEAHRGRGLARVVVQRAVEAAAEDGCDLLHLFAAGDDWPRLLYTKLGFDPVGEVLTTSLLPG